MWLSKDIIWNSHLASVIKDDPKDSSALPDVCESFNSFWGILCVCLCPSCSSSRQGLLFLEGHPRLLGMCPILLPQVLVPARLDQVLAPSSQDLLGQCNWGCGKQSQGNYFRFMPDSFLPQGCRTLSVLKSWNLSFHSLIFFFFFNNSGLISSLLVSARGVIFMETLNKIPSASFELWGSAKILL